MNTVLGYMGILEKLKDIGTDIDTTLERFMGNEDLYIKFLNKFTSDTSMQELELAVDCKDLKKAFNAAHTLKGVTGNLGLESLYNLLVPFVESLRKTDLEILSEQEEVEIKEGLREIKKAYEQINNIINDCQIEKESIL